MSKVAEVKFEFCLFLLPSISLGARDTMLNKIETSGQTIITHNIKNLMGRTPDSLMETKEAWSRR